MNWPFALALIIWAGAFVYAVRSWRLVKFGEMEQSRAQAERLDRATKRFFDQIHGGEVRSDNLRPVSEPVRPNFGRKPHVAVDNEKPPEGAA